MTRSRRPLASPFPANSSLEDNTSIRLPSVGVLLSLASFSRSDRSLSTPSLPVRDYDAAVEQLDFLRTKLDCCLVIDGESLELFTTQLTNDFIELATQLPCVVACRCSPTQKADVARLIRSHTKKRVCCIGDGGNDVSMIQAADVGLGIVGKEGKQASLAGKLGRLEIINCELGLTVHLRLPFSADFSITQFSFITKRTSLPRSLIRPHD